MQNNPFFEVMDNHPDQKLKEIVELKRGDYQPEALEAAEFVLRKRKVKFKEQEPDEVIEMTVEEIREDIIRRRQQGETLREIRIDYRSKGVDIDDLEDEHKEDVEKLYKAWNFRKTKFGFYLIGMTAALIVSLNNKGNKDLLNLVIGILAVAGVTWLYFLLRKPKQ